MNMDRQKVVVLLSGGMDSVCALYYSAKRYEVVVALSFNYGSNHSHKELPCASYHCEKLDIPHIVMDIDFIDKHFGESLLVGNEVYLPSYSNSNEVKKRAVPFRNGIMFSIAAGYAESKGAKGIVIATHSGEYSIYSDCREKFLKLMSQAIHAGTYNEIDIIKPFVFMTKDQVAKIGKEHGVDFSKTWSCCEGVDQHCGECDTCVERKSAFSSAGIADPTEYSSGDPLPPHPIN